MDLLDLFVKIGVKDEASDKVSSIGSKLKSGLATAGKVAAAGVAAAASAVGVLTNASIKAYASYEQLTGGVDTLFKTSADRVMKYADEAYKTAGMSANQYMETVTSFSASLLQGLGGDTAAAAEVANKAIIDMSDNANKMGTDIASIQYAYQGFAKQNYTMLDNLKLGYGGTQAEMARLINDSGVLGDTMTVTAETVNQVSFDKIIEAIHVVQTELGITGTTTKEASTTIEGSLNSAKAAWTNLITGIANENANLDLLIEQFVSSVETAGANIIPRIETILGGIGQLIIKMAPIISQTVPQLVSQVLPSFLDAGSQLLTGIMTGILTAAPQLTATAVDVITYLVQFLIENAPQILTAAAQIIAALATGIVENFPKLLESGKQMIGQLSSGIESGIPDMIAKLPQIIENILTFITQSMPSILEMGMQVLFSLVDGIVNAIPKLIESLPKIIESFVNFFTTNFPKIVQTGIDLLIKLIEGIIKSIPQLVAALPEIIWAIVKGIGSMAWAIIEAGANIVKGLWDGIVSMGQWLYDKVAGWVRGIVDIVKNVLGIHSPSRIFTNIGENMAKSLGEGWENEYAGIKKAIEGEMNFSGTISASKNSGAVKIEVSVNVEAGAIATGSDAAAIGRMIGENAARQIRYKGGVAFA